MFKTSKIKFYEGLNTYHDILHILQTILESSQRFHVSGLREEIDGYLSFVNHLEICARLKKPSLQKLMALLRFRTVQNAFKNEKELYIWKCLYFKHSFIRGKTPHSHLIRWP